MLKIVATTSSTAAMRPIQRSSRVTSGANRKVSSAASASGNEQIACKIKCGDDERREADFPHADKRLRGRDFGFW